MVIQVLCGYFGHSNEAHTKSRMALVGLEPYLI